MGTAVLHIVLGARLYIKGISDLTSKDRDYFVHLRSDFHGCRSILQSCPSSSRRSRDTGWLQPHHAAQSTVKTSGIIHAQVRIASSVKNWPDAHRIPAGNSAPLLRLSRNTAGRRCPSSTRGHSLRRTNSTTLRMRQMLSQSRIGASARAPMTLPLTSSCQDCCHQTARHIGAHCK